MEPGSLLGQTRSDFASIVSAELSDLATIDDGDNSVDLRGLFYEASIDDVPDTQASVTTPDYRLQIAETATDFALRRKGLLVTCRSKTFKVREWAYDGLGGLTLFLDEQKGEASASVPEVHVRGSMTEYFQEDDIEGGNTIRLRYIPLAGSIKVFARGERLVEGVHWQDNHDGTLTFLDTDWLPIGEDFVTVDYEIF